jgi:hypothetical protein
VFDEVRRARSLIAGRIRCTKEMELPGFVVHAYRFSEWNTWKKECNRLLKKPTVDVEGRFSSSRDFLSVNNDRARTKIECDSKWKS